MSKFKKGKCYSDSTIKVFWYINEIQKNYYIVESFNKRTGKMAGFNQFRKEYMENNYSLYEPSLKKLLKKL